MAQTGTVWKFSFSPTTAFLPTVSHFVTGQPLFRMERKEKNPKTQNSKQKPGLPICMSGFCAGNNRLFFTPSWYLQPWPRSYIGEHSLALPNRCSSGGCPSLYYVLIKTNSASSLKVYGLGKAGGRRDLYSNSLIALGGYLGCCEIFSSETSALELCHSQGPKLME